MSKDKPNIIFIVMDAVRAQNISCYGYHRNTMPMMEKILPSSMLYMNAISSSYWSLPSHASIFTGTYASKHGLVLNGDKIDDKFFTLAELLKSKGYNTVGLSGNDYISEFTGLDRGFTQFFGYEKIAGPIQKTNNYLTKKFHGIKPLTKKIDGETINDVSQQSSYKRNIFKTYSRARANIYERLFWLFTSYFDKSANNKYNVLKKFINKKKHSPFFIFLHYEETHSPYHPINPYRNKFISINSNNKLWEINQDPVLFHLGKSNMSNDDFIILKDLYDASINYLDQKIYEIVMLLEENHLLDNTMIIITSDHGENIGEHNLMHHSWCLYDTLIKVPLIIKYPENYNLNGKVTRCVQNVDLLPTIMDMLNINNHEISSQIQGNSLISNKIKNRSYEYAISELIKPFGRRPRKYKDYFKKFDRGLLCIRTENKKYIMSTSGNDEFYDLKTDPNETNNLINNKNVEKMILKQNLNLWLDNYYKMYDLINKKIEEDIALSIENNIKERLKKLGYL